MIKDTMTYKQRLLAALKGEEIDRIPWSPNLAYWWDHEDPEFLAQGEVEVLKSLGCDPLIRGHKPCSKPGDWETLRLYTAEYGNCAVETITNDNEKLIRYSTPKGELQARYTYSYDGKTWFLKKHPIAEAKDYEILIELFDQMSLVPDFSLYNDLTTKHGEEALIIPMLAPEPNKKSSYQALVEFWVGTEQLAYDTFDYPELIDSVIASMRRVSNDAARICAASPAEIFLTWEDTSTTNISPAYYEQYILPEINEWCDILHAAGKMYMQHACGHLKQIVPIMGLSEIDGIESISPPPTGNIELWDAAASMRDEQFLVGGIDATVFLGSTIEELELYVKKLLGNMEGKRFVLANSDSCPPYVSHEKFRMISKLVRGG